MRRPHVPGPNGSRDRQVEKSDDVLKGSLPLPTYSLCVFFRVATLLYSSVELDSSTLYLGDEDPTLMLFRFYKKGGKEVGLHTQYKGIILVVTPVARDKGSSLLLRFYVIPTLTSPSRLKSRVLWGVEGS